MNRAGLMDEFIENVLGRAKDALSGFSDFVFVGELWLVVITLGVVLTVVCIYLPWQWLRSALGFLLAVAIAGAVGATAMWKRMRGETGPLRERVRELEAEKRKQEGGGHWPF